MAIGTGLRVLLHNGSLKRFFYFLTQGRKVSKNLPLRLCAFALKFFYNLKPYTNF